MAMAIALIEVPFREQPRWRFSRPWLAFVEGLFQITPMGTHLQLRLKSNASFSEAHSEGVQNSG